jgi:alpha-glucosidase (family GH31 glycosyl hydrolase)
MGVTDAAGSADQALTWEVGAQPFRLTIRERGDVLVRQRVGPAGAGTRFSYRRQDDGTMGTLTSLIATTRTPGGARYTVATTEPARMATVTVTRTGRGLRIDLDLGSAGAAVRTVYDAFDATPSEHFLGAGEQRDHVDLQGAIVPLKVWDPCGTGKSAPFYLSSKGYGINVATTAVGRIAFGRVNDANGCQLGTSPCEIASGIGVVQMCFKTNRLSYEIYPGSPSAIVRAYLSSIGRPPLPDPKAFALAKWRDRLSSASELDEDVDRFAAAGIPLGWVIIDNPWETGLCAGSLEFDPTLFPDPTGTIEHLHARGVSVMMWVSPTIRPPCGLGIYPPNRILGTETFRAIDLTDPVVLATFEERLRGLLAAGVDGFKADRGDEVDLEQTQLAGGSGADLHNRYPVLFAEAVAQASAQAVGRSVPTMFRGGFSGSQHLDTGAWSGDLRGSWNGLENAIRSAQTAGVVGYSTWGSDVGGYLSQSLTADVFERWSQLGAVSPIFEVGGDGPNATPWVLGNEAMSGLKKASLLHYELFPYHYQLARLASSTGVSILRPLALQYPADERSWQADHELLVGPDLLAAPVTVPGTTADVYLPPGRWVDLGSGARRVGPVELHRPTPLDELPLYLRVGAAIPFNLRSPDVWSNPWQLNDQFRAGRGGWLVAPGSDGKAAGTSADYGTIRATGTAAAIRLRLTRARRETPVVVLGRRPTTVVIDGRLVRCSASAVELRGRRQGWLVHAGPFPGVVLKLAPRSGRSSVLINY